MPEEERILNSAARWFYLLVLFLGIAFYLSWGILYDGWTDVGVYAITIVMVCFGLFGVALYFGKKEE
jgi:cation transport ATPase